MTTPLLFRSSLPRASAALASVISGGSAIGLSFWLSTAVSSLRPIEALPFGEALAVLYTAALAAGGVWLWRRPAAPGLTRAGRWLSRPAVIATAVAALCLFNAFFFEWNNSLKAVGRDSTGDDAIIEAFRAFAAGLPMYSARLYDGAPISPGPLWVLQNGWLATLGAHFLMTPLYLVAVLLLLEPAQRGWFCALCLLNPLVWTTSGAGHDHVAIGLAFLACLLWARRSAGVAPAIGLTLASAVLATSRVVYLGFPLLLALHATRLAPRVRWMIGGLGTALALAAHVVFIAQDAPYQPSHLFHRGLTMVGLPLMLAGGAGGLLVLALAWHRASTRPRGSLDWAVPACFAAVLLVPHAAIALGMLLSVQGRVADWEGASYLMPALPALAYACLLAAQVSPPTTGGADA
jgi:hypothetical protein